MNKTKPNTITMDQYARYPWWNKCEALMKDIIEGRIYKVELVRTTWNTLSYRLYKITSIDMIAHTVKVKTTFKEAGLEEFINAVICGIRVHRDEYDVEPEPVISSDNDYQATFNAYREGYRDGQCDMYVLMNKKEG